MKRGGMKNKALSVRRNSSLEQFAKCSFEEEHGAGLCVFHGVWGCGGQGAFAFQKGQSKLTH